MSKVFKGATPHSLARRLTEQGILSPGGRETWSQSAVKSILTNEKYKGDALLQKSYMEDFLAKKKNMNEGEIRQYYVENSHECIIEPLVYETVQQEIARHKPGKNRHSGVGLFASRISSAATAAAGTALRFGPATPSTAAQFGSAATSSKTTANAKRRNSTRRASKNLTVLTNSEVVVIW